MKKEDYMLVSVVIPVFKTEMYLRDAIESVIEQNYPNKEIILVDDGSPDKAPIICDEYARKIEWIRCIHKKNGGLSSARNEGIKQSLGKYILFLDSDDILYPNCLEVLVQVAIKNKADAVFPDRYIWKNEEGREELRKHFNGEYYTNAPKEFYYNVLIQQGRAWRASAVLYDLDLINRNNITFPLGRISEDFFFNSEVLNYSEKIICVPMTTLINIKHCGTITNSYIPFYYSTILEIYYKCKRDFPEKEYSFGIASSLVANASIYIMKIMSNKNSTSWKKKRKTTKVIYDSKELIEALKTPYKRSCSPNRKVSSYIFIMRFLMKLNMRLTADSFARIVSSIINY